MKSYPLHNLLLAMLLSVPILGTLACGEGPRSDPAALEDESAVGSLEFALTLPDGDQVSAVEWELDGPPLNTPWNGVIDVTGEGKTASVTISGLPAGPDYTLTLTATTDQGSLCQGSASFAIRADEVTRLALVLNCQSEGRGQGSLGVSGEFNQCPSLGRVTVTPTEVVVGNSIELDASASDADGDELSYAWSVISGVGDLAAPGEAVTVFTCTHSGSVVLRLAVSDGSGCEGAFRDFEIYCAGAEFATTTTIAASAIEVVQGSAVTLTATVSPAGARGAVEFRAGVSVLGRAPVTGGLAQLVVELGLGTHWVEAAFVPEEESLAEASTSSPVRIVVSDSAALPFGISGLADSYHPGDVLNATVVGAVLGANRTYRWLLRPIGVTSTGATVQTSTSPTYTQALNASDDGYELSVALRQCNNASCSSSTLVAQTPWVRINVAQDGPRPVLIRTLGSNPILPGDAFRLETSGLNLATGETSQIVYRSGASAWLDADTGVPNFYSFAYPEPHVVEGVRLTRFNAVTLNLAVRVLRDGVAVRQSAPIVLENRNHEVQIEGLQQLYMEGAIASLSAEIYPQRAGDDYVYQWEFSKVANFDTSNPSTVVWGEGEALPSVVERLLNVADHNEGYLRVRVIKPGWSDMLWSDSVVAVSGSVRLYVTDDPDLQLFFFHELSGHYHQGGTVSLRLTVYPGLSLEDQIIWEWQWPGMAWEPLPSAAGELHTLIAEQALDGVRVRATLDFAVEGKESIVADPITIFVDDHGAVARQIPTVVGETSVREGARVTLSLQLPANGSTVLNTHRWERRAAGGSGFTPLEGETGATLSFIATSADHGAEYRVTISKPNGEIAYGPSSAVALIVGPRDGGGGDTVPRAVASTPNQGAVGVYPSEYFLDPTPGRGIRERVYVRLTFDMEMNTEEATVVLTDNGGLEEPRTIEGTWDETGHILTAIISPHDGDSTGALFDETTYHVSFARLESSFGIPVNPADPLYPDAVLTFTTGVRDALINHACIHTQNGPFREVSALATPLIWAPGTDLSHHHYTITLPAGSGVGYTSYFPVATGFFRLYARGAQELQLETAIVDWNTSQPGPWTAVELEGAPAACYTVDTILVDPETGDRTLGPPVVGITHQFTLDLDDENFYLFRWTSPQDTIQIVVEYAGEEL